MSICDEKIGIVTEIIDKETIKVKVVNSDEIRKIKGDKFYISDLKEAYTNEHSESEGVVLIKFNNVTNRLIEEYKERDL
ncbi:hypothetical protein [Clostridium neonatale]|uniref:hypothetical protein n=1 Tax=Clostridium neonatale TaxID=137838 RepID=UPI00291C3CC3|nr:hypothetical protein [Clostridium neonatale]CAI3207685.1 hypothetical protein CNEO2_360029 [Clostridium neonatale]